MLTGGATVRPTTAGHTTGGDEQVGTRGPDRVNDAEHSLRALGIDTLSQPVRTRAGAPGAMLDGRPFFLFAFIPGERASDGDASLSPASLNYDFGAYVDLLARIHAATARLRAAVPREDFALPWAAEYEELFARALSLTEPTVEQPQLRRLDPLARPE
jgi:hypothetical protein